jgi:hypothetical protein
MDFLKGAPGSHSDTCVSSHDGYQSNNIKVEYIADIQQGEDPLLMTHPVIKSEHEVSCVCALLCTFHMLCQYKTVILTKLLLTEYDAD